LNRFVRCVVKGGAAPPQEAAGHDANTGTKRHDHDPGSSTPAPAGRPSIDQILRLVVAMVGLIEDGNGLTDLSIFFGGDIATIPGYSPGGLTIMASIVLSQ
jgi:hypothetical protein